MKYQDALQQYFAKGNFYHFTDVRNIPGIKAANGILSRREAHRLDKKIEVTGGNNWSIKADDKRGLDAYVHLCFTSAHPMEFRAKEDGRIQTSTFLTISADILKMPGTLCTLDVSNKTGVKLLSLEEACEHLDFEVLYHRTEWKDPEVKKRLLQARKYEILVPTKVPLALILGY